MERITVTVGSDAAWPSRDLPDIWLSPGPGLLSAEQAVNGERLGQIDSCKLLTSVRQKTLFGRKRR